MAEGRFALIFLCHNGAESLMRAGKAEWVGAPAAGLSARGVEGSAARMRRCAWSGELSAARLHRPHLSGYTDSPCERNHGEAKGC